MFIKNIKTILAITSLLFIFSCCSDKNSEKDTIEANDNTLIVNKAIIIKSGRELLTKADMQKGTNGRVKLYDKNSVSFQINKMLDAKPLGNGKFQIKNWLPHEFKEVSLYFKTKEMDKHVKIVDFKEIPPSYEYTLSFDKTKSEFIFKDENKNNVKVSIDQLNASAEDISLFFKTEDVIFKKIESIKLDTEYYFTYMKHRELPVELTEKDARDYIPILVNMAYLYSSSLFEDRIMNSPYDFINIGKVYDKKKIIKKCREHKSPFGIGVLRTTNKLGIAYATTALAIQKEFLCPNEKQPNNAFYNVLLKEGAQYMTPGKAETRRYLTIIDTYSHETGHTKQFVHDGNMTYPKLSKDKKSNVGLSIVVVTLYQDLLRKGELPFCNYPYGPNTIKTSGRPATNKSNDEEFLNQNSCGTECCNH